VSYVNISVSESTISKPFANEPGSISIQLMMNENQLILFRVAAALNQYLSNVRLFAKSGAIMTCID
jgi:hypothetical protein